MRDFSAGAIQFYPGWQYDEYRAFQEYVKENHIKYKYLAYTDRDTQVCVEIIQAGQPGHGGTDGCI